ncbi:MAG: ATP-binding cassette domain-containing protein [Devosia sp.]|nr:ATP-binding cassette domain-containing protein [Devosia sp.]
MGSLTLKSVEKSFGATKVLHGIDLEVADGEFVIFVGPSGCGKSTLLRIIAGLEDSSGGEVRIDGVRVDVVPPAKRGIAMVFQTYALYPHMTVFDNMAAGIRQAGASKEQVDARVGEATRMLSLEDYLKRRPAELSGGQRQRVAIGRAVVREPKLFLFDEPLSNLDAALRVNTRLEIARLHRELEATMIYVTHDQVEAMTLADRIVVMNAGRIEQIGTPMELYNTPANTFVAGFIGSPQMNFHDAASLGIAGAKTAGIRPEHLRLSPDKGDWRGKVVHVEHLGADTNVYIETEAAGLITARVFGEVAYAPDSVLYASADPKHIFRFDEAGKVIR